MEGYKEHNKRETPKWLKPEEVKVWEETDIILSRVWQEIHKIIETAGLSLDSSHYEEMENLQDKIQNFKKKLEAKNIIPQNFLLWHRLIGSTAPKEVTELDAPDHDIENFIKSLEK